MVKKTSLSDDFAIFACFVRLRVSLSTSNVFCRLCVSLCVFARLCPSLRVFARLCVSLCVFA